LDAGEVKKKIGRWEWGEQRPAAKNLRQTPERGMQERRSPELSRICPFLHGCAATAARNRKGDTATQACRAREMEKMAFIA
jgi:hypothetical protein